MNFNLSTNVEKNGELSTQNNTDSHETIIKPVMQSYSSIMQLVSPMILMHSTGADPGFLLGGGAPLRNDVTIQDFSEEGMHL